MMSRFLLEKVWLSNIRDMESPLNGVDEMKGIPPMKVRLFGLVSTCFLVALLVLFISSQTQSQGNTSAGADGLSQAEQDLLNEINQVRAHPDVYSKYLQSLKPFFKGKDYQPNGQPSLKTNEGWDAVQDAIIFLSAAKPQGRLNTSRGLRLAAVTHFRDQNATGAIGHRGASSSMIEDRVKPFGTWQGAIGESLSYGNESARERVLTWLIDDGVVSRGHRKRLLSPDYNVAGLSCGAHPRFGTMCVLTLAGGFVDLQPAKTSAGASTNTANDNATRGKSNKAAPAKITPGRSHR